MPWYLNFCAPVTNNLEINRKALVGNLVLLLGLYVFIKFLDECRYE
jgi:hypothetical protein